MVEQAGGGFDDRYVGFREHSAALEEVRSQMAALELAQAKQGVALLHLPDQVTELGRQIAELGRQIRERPAPAVAQDQTLLMMHRMLDSAAQKNGGGPALIQNAVWLVCGSALMWIAGQVLGLG